MALNFALGGLDVRGYHAGNIALHVLCGLALFGTVRRTLLAPVLRERFERDADVVALFCALLWLVHPLQTEAVNYITQRSEVMMGLFFLLTRYCTIRESDSRHRSAWDGGWLAPSALVHSRK